jgi:multiple sugar transport system ATP-binding protein
VLGVRPEHILVNDEGDGSASQMFDGIVDIVEPMGSDSLLWLKVEGQAMSARVESSARFAPGEKVKLRFRVNLASVFDEATSDRL